MLILMVVEMSNLRTADLVDSCPDYKSNFAEIVTALAALPPSKCGEVTKRSCPHQDRRRAKAVAAAAAAAKSTAFRTYIK